LRKIGQKFEMLVASGETNGNNDCFNAWLGFRKSRNTSLTWIFICFFWFLNLSVSYFLLMYICLFGCHSLQEISFGIGGHVFESNHGCEFLLTTAFSKIFCLCED
jgi:hypothetical protein